MALGLKVNRYVFFPAATLIILFVLVGAVFRGPMETFFGALQGFIVEHFGWLYILAAAGFVVFVIYLALSPYAHVRLGKDDDEPEFAYPTWLAMLFSAGMGIGLVFYGVAEPILHFGNPPYGEPRTVDAARDAMNLTFFHWGLHAWSIYIVVGMSLAYFAYRHDLPLTVRSTLYPLIGRHIHGPVGNLIDVLAVFGTMFGLATSLGLGVMQINAGLDYLGVLSLGVMNQIILIAVITAAATISVVTGVANGIRRLSELNMLIAALLLVFVLVAGPTVFLVSTLVQSVGQYASSFVGMTLRTDAFSGLEWQRAWTMFYWGWWVSWAPFVGMFIARVSRGRTVREFVVGVLAVPTLMTFVWMTIFGATAIHLDRVLDGALVAAVQESVPTAIFVMLNELPLASITAVLTTFVVAIFFVTSADSGSLVMDILSSGGDTDTRAYQKIFWAVLVGAVAGVLLLVGGLGALQTAAITTALPFVVVMILMCVALFRALRAERVTTDPLVELWGTLRHLPETALRTVFRPPPAAATREGSFRAAETPSRAAALDAGDWRERLRRLAADPEPAYARPVSGLSEAREHLRQFFQETVQPAFEALRGELEALGRTVTTQIDDARAELVVYRHGGEEFRYAIDGHARETAAFAFPNFDTRRRTRRTTAEVVLRTGKQVEHDTRSFNQQQIIDDFLAAYAKWMGW